MTEARKQVYGPADQSKGIERSRKGVVVVLAVMRTGRKDNGRDGWGGVSCLPACVCLSVCTLGRGPGMYGWRERGRGE
jgi:hypothetical protein